MLGVASKIVFDMELSIPCICLGLAVLTQLRPPLVLGRGIGLVLGTS